jgi:chromosome segregation ATPase
METEKTGLSKENSDAGSVTSLSYDAPTRPRQVLQESVENIMEATTHKNKVNASISFAGKHPPSIDVSDKREQQLPTKPVEARTSATNDETIHFYDESKNIGTDTARAFSVIESAMANYSFSKESKLSQVWASWEENNKSVSIDEILAAAIADLLNHQSSFVTAERNISDMKVSNDQMENDVRIQKRIGELETEIATLQTDAGEYLAKKEKMIANLKKKKTAIADLEAKLEEAEKDLLNLSSENDSLRRGIEAVSEARDSLKNKLRCQQENTKDIKKSLQSAESAMRFFRDKCVVQGEVSYVNDRGKL